MPRTRCFGCRVACERSFLTSDLGQELSEERRHPAIDEGESVPRRPCYVVVDAVAHSLGLPYLHREPSSVYGEWEPKHT
jgi:hypothetical protein